MAAAVVTWRRRRAGTAHQWGFTLLELSVAMVVIALILGATMKATSLFALADAQRAHVTFLQGWVEAFSVHIARLRLPPGDDPANPTYRVGSPDGTGELCNRAAAPFLSNAFLAQGIELPSGQSAGQEDQYVYQDSERDPHRLVVCFRTTDWTKPGMSVGTTRTQPQHVLHVRGVTVELARLLDSTIDGLVNAQDGRVRLAALANSGSLMPLDWGATPRTELEIYIAVK